MNNQIQQKSTISTKTLNFQGNSIINLTEFKSFADINELIKTFGSRDCNEDSLALKKIGIDSIFQFLTLFLRSSCRSNLFGRVYYRKS